ncbi:hypothetical protein ABWJ92_38400 [Streptomyces sp. NPDC000609]|uniref:hypothetical protein n=1 Tax=Streptomyces sp. NPDC000609 TaxID=3160957 RepID=UPI003398D5BD
MIQNSKLFEPVSTVVSVLVRLLIGLLVAGFVLSWFGANHHFGWSLSQEAVDRYRGRFDIVLVGLGSHHFPVESPEATAELLAEAATR